jgi:hypothetical protein
VGNLSVITVSVITRRNKMAEENPKWIEKYRQAFDDAKGKTGRDPKWQGVACIGEGCELCNQLWPRCARKNRHMYPEAVWKLALDLRPQSKFFANVVLKSDPKKVVVLEYTQSVQDALIAAAAGKDEGGNDRFYSYEHGKNVVILKTGKERDTRYQVRFKDRSPSSKQFAKQAYDLANSLEMREIEDGPVIRASKLEEGANEMRFLANWLAPDDDVEDFFWEWKHHMGISPEKYEAMQKGEYSPFSDEAFAALEGEETESYEGIAAADKEEDIPMFEDDEGRVIHATFDDEDSVVAADGTNTGETQTENASVQATEGAGHQRSIEPAVPVDVDAPACYGHGYEPNDEECTECPHGTKCLGAVRSA